MHPRLSNPPRPLAGLLLGGLALVGAFTWGFFTHRERSFPFSWVRQLALSTGALRPAAEIGLQSRAAETPRFEALPYLAGVLDPAAEAHGVLRLEAERVMPGLTLVTSRVAGTPVVWLVTLQGEPRWTWRLPQVAALQLAVLLAEGDLLVVDQGHALVRFDRTGRMLWRRAGGFHHAAVVGHDTLWALRSRSRIVPEVHPRAKVLDDEIVTLDHDGREMASRSILDALLASPYAFLLPAPEDRQLEEQAPGRSLAELELDILHTNHLEPSNGAGGLPDPGSDAGGWLLSVRNLNLLVEIGSPEGGITWAWGPGHLTAQHHPTLLPSGRVLVFDNGRNRSRLLELDPRTRRIAWRYSSPDFFTTFGGSCQRLANGNTLVTESMTGYVFEITPQGRRVWIWANPDVSQNGVRQALYRATRYPYEELGWLTRGNGLR